MEWFKRKPKPPPPTSDRLELPDGLWTKCNSCGEIIYVKELEKNLWVCNRCDYHFRIKYTNYLEILTDDDSFREFDSSLVSLDPLGFRDSKKYPDRISDTRQKTGMNDAVVCGLAS
jgi:acetyl-CoA carboxylase carboxyl transferase subunit beta